MNLKHLLDQLEDWFPLNNACNWDSVGIQNTKTKLDHKSTLVNNVLIALDLTTQALTFAIENKVNVIITRHPFIFHKLKSEKHNLAKLLMLKKLKTHNILVFSIHTNFDNSINNGLIKLLSDNFKIKTHELSSMLNTFLLETPMLLQEFIAKLQITYPFQTFKTSKIILDDIISFNLVEGSGASIMIKQQIQNQVFITGEVKWNEWIYANDNNVLLIEVGHYMENNFIEVMKSKLLENLPAIKVITFDIENQFKELK